MSEQCSLSAQFFHVSVFVLDPFFFAIVCTNGNERENDIQKVLDKMGKIEMHKSRLSRTHVRPQIENDVE